MAEEFHERTEQATPKRREDARKKGKVVKSYEINSAMMMLISALIFYLGGKYFYTHIAKFSTEILSNLANFTLTKENVSKLSLDVLTFLNYSLFPLVIILTIFGIGVNVAQSGYVFTLEPLRINFERLNPFTGIRRILFSRRSLFELGKGFIKVSVVGLVVFLVLKNLSEDVIALIDADVRGIANFFVSSGLSLLLKASLVYLLISTFDFAFQRWEYERELKMTRQEVKEELKELEGDPLIKARIRKRQREIARMRMMQNVPKADVVITNPTHIAVALKYDSAKMNAPKVVAKGANYLAERIKEIAKENGVPIVEDKPLAQALYKMVDVDQEIPPQLYRAVAKVFAYVFNLKRKSFVKL